MGNSQSEVSDDEDRPTYDYHKNVFSEAEVDTRYNSSIHLSNEEHYLTADEGDSVRSITPPRNRPESSSGEEFSDSDVGQDDEDDDDNNERNSLQEQTETVLNATKSKKLLSKKSCGQCNVSTFQEHDSIGPELETARQTNKRSVSSIQNKSLMASPAVSSTFPKTSKSSNHNSPFKPISSDSKLNISSVNSSVQDRSGKRKRLGYFDSSDSEESEQMEKSLNKTQGHSSIIRKKIKSSMSTSKLIPQSGKILGQQIVQDSDTNSEHSDLQRSTRKRIKKIPSTQNKTWKRRKESEHRQKEPNLEEENVDELNKEGYATGVSVLSEVISENCSISIPDIQLENPLTVPNDFQRGENLNSSKVGSRHVKNTLGKIVPISQTTQSVLIKAGEPSNLKMANIFVNSEKSAFVLKQPVGKPHTLLQENQGPVSMSKASAASTPKLSNENEAEETLFKNVVLTPTKRKWTQPVEESLTACSNRLNQTSPYDDNDVIMEVDNRNNSSVCSPENQTHQYKKNSAAEKLKSFWSEKKQNISSNLKSFFSGSLSPSSSLNSSISNQNFSPVSKSPNSCSILKSPQNTKTTYLSSNMKKRSFFSSSPQDSSTLEHGHSRADTSSIQTSPHSLQLMSPIVASNTFNNMTQHKDIQSMLDGSFRTDLSVNSRQVIQDSRISNTSNKQNTKNTSKEILAIDILPNSEPNQVLKFQLANFLTVCVSVGDLSEQMTVGIVNWTDGGLTHTVTKCSQKIASKAGALMRAACNDYIENKGSDLEAPDVLTTPAGGQFDRSVEAILHVVAPFRKDREESNSRRALLEVYANCLRFADERLGLESISFPLIAEDIFPLDVCVDAFFDSLLLYLQEHIPMSPPKITFIQLITPQMDIAQFAKDFILPRLNERTNMTGCGTSNNCSVTDPVVSPGTSVIKSQTTKTTDRAPSGRPLASFYCGTVIMNYNPLTNVSIFYLEDLYFIGNIKKLQNKTLKHIFITVSCSATELYNTPDILQYGLKK
ncbi:hypothetical protein Btru_030287 [Bulinus truncatus]|nr:hypothetical protein Btru_030287 [Bulinus truncatus]